MNRIQTHLAGFAVLASVLAFASACSDETSATDLNPDGPPMIRQVRLTEQRTVGTARVFAFGTHPDAVDMNGAPDPTQEHAVTSAVAQGNGLRIIFDELLVGNSLQEVQCRGVIDDDAYDSVPIGDTPDDVARCAAPKDVLPQTCTGPTAICVCHLDGGCMVVDGTSAYTVDKGAAVGILDTNKDGAADSMRFIKGAVGLKCDNADIQIDLGRSYYNPSGDQNVPAVGGFEALGPAVILAPAQALPTGATCGLTFAADVTDKTDNQVCAPANGDIHAACTPGDVSAFSFQVQALSVQIQGPTEGQTGVDRLSALVIVGNVPLAADTASKITITDNGAAFTNFTAMSMSNNSVILLTPGGTGFSANSPIVVTVPTTVTDTAGSHLPTAVTLHFTTGA